MASLSELLEEVQASLDLILREAVLRICDGNMQVRGHERLVGVGQLRQFVVAAARPESPAQAASACPLHSLACSA